MMAADPHISEPTIVDLENYRNKGVILFSGRPKGEALRAKLRLDEIDVDPTARVKFLVPDEIVSLNSSFFLGLFSQSVKRLGEKEFRDKYIIEGPPEIEEDVDGGIRQALRDSNPLPVK
ncbi:MAG: hypothetical protein QOE70_188 [Chthoniobacter sp.]|jgi:hypothetical protein|nr:hypothetical protein [Chthoniobacter sp.]